MYCLRVCSIVVLQELHDIVYCNVYCDSFVVFIEMYVYTKFHLDWLLCH